MAGRFAGTVFIAPMLRENRFTRAICFFGGDPRQQSAFFAYYSQKNRLFLKATKGYTGVLPPVYRFGIDFPILFYNSKGN